MKTLTINQKVFKHQDTQTKLKIALFENNSKVSLDSNSEYQFKIKNSPYVICTSSGDFYINIFSLELGIRYPNFF